MTDTPQPENTQVPATAVTPVVPTNSPSAVAPLAPVASPTGKNNAVLIIVGILLLIGVVVGVILLINNNNTQNRTSDVERVLNNQEIPSFNDNQDLNQFLKELENNPEYQKQMKELEELEKLFR